jgi:hypothetical protein
MCVLDAEIYCETGPQTDYRAGMFHVTQRISDTIVIRRCYSPNTFIAAIVEALDAIEQFQAEQGGAKVVAFPNRLLRSA